MTALHGSALLWPGNLPLVEQVLWSYVFKYDAWVARRPRVALRPASEAVCVEAFASR